MTCACFAPGRARYQTPGLCTVLDESEVLQQPDEALLASRVLEDRHVDLVRVLAQRIVEDDLEESLAELEPIHLDLERADLQSTLGRETRLDVVVVLVGSFHFEIEEGDEIITLRHTYAVSSALRANHLSNAAPP